MCVNGLFSCADHWDNCKHVIEQKVGREDVMVHASCVNEFQYTFHGIDCCGHRLASEICDIVEKHDSLEEISVIGHSMGGLISRYALGLLYDSESGTLVSGRLKPMHFIAVASPHCGVTAGKSTIQLPLTTWAGSFLQPILSVIGSLVARNFLHASGKQLFGNDRKKGGGPTVLTQLVLDQANMASPPHSHAKHLKKHVKDHSRLSPSQSLLCYSALSKFRTRTSYANTHADVWVTWENASIRESSQLPHLEPELVAKATGVVHEDFWAGNARLETKAADGVGISEMDQFINFGNDLPKNR
eukprot:gene17627-23968_t